jgi:hypothetical protein
MSDHREPWDSDADPGDETDEPGEDFEYTIDFDPDFAWVDTDAGEPRTVPSKCPKCGSKDLRFANDLSFWCYGCDEGFFPSPETKAA